MSRGHVLVTGGAGFIGSHVVDRLLARGYKVRVLDSLVEQVHHGQVPRHLSAEAELIIGDVRSESNLTRALKGVDSVLHLAAEVGVGQSMYEISRYVDGNCGATGVLLEQLASGRYDVGRFVVASSMSIYGEGLYTCATHGAVHPKPREEEQLLTKDWEERCPQCGETVEPIPTHEDKPINPTSVYAVSKLDQELLCLSVGAAYGIGTVALRFFNTYGPRQALSNPYTGVAAIFSSRLLNGKSPLVFEDGRQLRDFIHVTDTARAVVRAMEAESVSNVAINVGTGRPVTVNDVAKALASRLGVDIEPEVTEQYRAGDIRHCWADPKRAYDLLGFEAEVPFYTGVGDLVEWVAKETATDLVELAQHELQSRGLAR
jgi:dTDP-L-rhamnose 4-epimerase